MNRIHFFTAFCLISLAWVQIHAECIHDRHNDEPVHLKYVGRALIGGQEYDIGVHLERSSEKWSGQIDVDEIVFGQFLSNVQFANRALSFSVAHPQRGTLRFEADVQGKIAKGVIKGGGQGKKIGQFALHQTVTLTTAELSKFVGRYKMPALGNVLIYPESAAGHRLRVSVLGLSFAKPLFAISENEFLPYVATGSNPVETRLEFVKGKHNQIEKLIVHRGGKAITGDRQIDSFKVSSKRIESWVNAALDDRKIPGCSIGIIHGNDLIYANGFGYADLESKTSAKPATLYQIGSITKTLTATLVMILAEQGKLHLDDAVVDHLPKSVSFQKIPPEQRRLITIRRLLTHTSGLPRDVGNRLNRDGSKSVLKIQDLHRAIRETRLRRPVNERWDYSNFGFAVLGNVIENIAGTNYESFARKKLLQPLGMSHTRASIPSGKTKQFATHYWIEDPDRRARPAWDFGQVPGAGGAVSNVNDLAKFISWQMRAGQPSLKPLNGASLAQMHQPTTLRRRKENSMGIGWWIDDQPVFGKIVKHGGETDGHSSFVAFSPDHKVGVVVLANLGGDTADFLGNWLIKHVISEKRRQTIANIDQAVAYHHNGDWGNAKWANQSLLMSTSKHGPTNYRLGVASFHLGNLATAESSLKIASTNGYSPALVNLMLARISAVRGEHPAAIRYLQEARKSGLKNIESIRQESTFAELKNDPSFKALFDKSK